jgi:large subunit ribosomal protein L24
MDRIRINTRLTRTKIQGAFEPFYQRIQNKANRERRRQLPFLAISKHPSTRPPIPDPRNRRLVKVDLAREMNIQVGDRVKVLFGSEKGKLGVVGRIYSEKNQVLVTGVNLKRSFWHPEPGPGKPSIISVECPIHITNVVLIDPVTKKPTRVKRRIMMNGEAVRISKVSGSAMPQPVPVSINEREVLWAKHQEQALERDKARRGPLKEDIFGSREHFKTLVRIVRQAREAAESQQAAQAGRPFVE